MRNPEETTLKLESWDDIEKTLLEMTKSHRNTGKPDLKKLGPKIQIPNYIIFQSRI